MRKLLTPIFIVLVAVMLMSMVGCGGDETTTTTDPTTTTTATTSTTSTTTTAVSTTTDAIKTGGTLKYIYDVSPATIPGWPYNEQDQQRIWANWVCFEPLVKQDANGEPTPWLATDWEWAEDKMSITFDLREDVTFHDGVTFNADAVIVLADKLFEDSSSVASYWESWEKVDDMTVKCNLPNYDNNFWNSIHDFVQVSPEVVNQGVEYATQNPTGTGPFTFLDFKKDVYLKFTKYDNYWQEGKPYLDEIDLLTVVEGLTQQAQMQAGEVDMMGVMQGKILQDLGNAGFVVVPQYGGTNFLLFDTKNEGAITNDPKVRMALEYATNKQEMVDALGYGYYIANNQILPPNNPGHTEDLGSRDYDPEKAQELMNEAGYADGFELDLVVLNIYQDAGVMMQQYYEEIGIDVNLQVVESAGYWEYILGGWNGVLFAGYGMPLNIAYFITNYFPPVAAFDVSTEIPAEMVELADAYISEKDPATAKALNDQLNQMIFDQCYFVPFYSNAFAHVLAPYVQGGGFMEYVDFQVWDPQDIWLDK